MAQVFDARNAKLTRNDRILVDTNVALDLASTLGGSSREMRQRDYSQFVQRVRSAGGELIISVLSFLEISNRIERQRACDDLGRTDANNLELKRHRRVSIDFRRRVAAEIEFVWSELRSYMTVLEADISSGEPERSYLGSFQTGVLDAFDIALLFESKRSNISSIVTHDGDFASAPIVVFTANERMIREAGRY